MRSLLLLSLMLDFLALKIHAQDSVSATQPTITTTIQYTSLTPAMSSSSVASYFSALATSAPIQPGNGPSAGDVGSAPGSSAADSDAGAAGNATGSFTISKGGIIAIITLTVCVVIFGITSSVLFYLAKKRSWEVRKTIRRSARKVATALTPRRATFSKNVQKAKMSSRGLTRIDEVPPTPKPRSSDIEKGNSKMSYFEMSEPPKQSRWAKKFGR